jgi:hypothetical protein
VVDGIVNILLAFVPLEISGHHLNVLFKIQKVQVVEGALVEVAVGAGV